MYFEYDVFFSYSTSNKEVETWINNLKHHLSLLLGQILNKDVNVITSKDVVMSVDIMGRTGVCIAIETAEYAEDLVEQFHLAEFKKLTQGKRIFKIVKEKGKENSETELLKSISSIDFYHVDTENKFNVNNDQFLKTEVERLYWLKVVDLAYAVYKCTVAETDKKILHHRGKTVFVAEASVDRIKYRDVIVRELRAHGYSVLPDAPLPKNKSDFKQQTISYLKESDLAIHIMGEQYGEIVGEGKLSRVDIQNKLASEVVKTNKSLERLIWISPVLKEFDEQQRIYLAQLRTDRVSEMGQNLF